MKKEIIYSLKGIYREDYQIEGYRFGEVPCRLSTRRWCISGLWPFALRCGNFPDARRYDPTDF